MKRAAKLVVAGDILAFVAIGVLCFLASAHLILSFHLLISAMSLQYPQIPDWFLWLAKGSVDKFFRAAVNMAGAAGFVLWLWMVIDCKLFARRHKGTTEGTERAIWFDILILGILMGSMPGIVYWFMVKRPELLFGPQIVKEKPHRLRQRLTGDILVATAILLTIILIAALILRFKVFHLERMLQLSPEGFERVFRMMVLMGALGWLSIPLWGGIWLWLYLDCVKRQFPVTSEKIV